MTCVFPAKFMQASAPDPSMGRGLPAKLFCMKSSLINLYYDLQVTLPARYYEQGVKTYAKLSRIEDILWRRYGYDIALKHSFKTV
jgi:hypothetical protein